MASRRVGETRHDAAGVHHRLLADTECGATGPQADREIAGAQSQAEGGSHVVTGAGAHHRAVRAPCACGLGRCQHIGQQCRPVAVGVHQRQQVGAVPLLGRRPPPGARRVAPVGSRPPGELGGQPVVGQQHRSEPVEGGAFAASQPPQLRDGGGGHQRRAARRRPRRSATGQGLGQGHGIGSGLGVVPQLGRAQDLPGVVECDQAVLLARDRDRRGPVRPEQVRLVGSGHERGPPRGGVLLAARRCRGWVRCEAAGHDLAAVGIVALDLAARRRRVDPRDESHQRTPMSSSVTSWSRRSCA